MSESERTPHLKNTLPHCHKGIWNLVGQILLLLLFSHAVVPDSLRPHGLHHVRLPCPSPSPRACTNSCPSSRWCHPTISSSVVPFSCLQSFPASGSFLMCQFFASGGQSIGVSASASVLPMNIQDWSPLGSTGLISFLSKGLSRVFSNTTVQKHQNYCTKHTVLTGLNDRLSLSCMFLIPSSCATYCQIQVKVSSNKYSPGVAFIRHPSPIRIPTLTESHETWCPIYSSHSTVSLFLHSLELFHIHYYLLNQQTPSFGKGLGLMSLCLHNPVLGIW